MNDPTKKRYFYTTMAVFSAIALSILVFFLLFRLQGVGEVVDSLVQILAPFIYGGVVAYLLRPMCNWFEGLFSRQLPEKMKDHAPVLAIISSLIVTALLIYALIAMVVPQVYDSVVTMWSAIPAKVRQFIEWADATFGEDERIDVILNSFNTSYEKLYSELGDWVSGTVVPKVTSAISGFGSSMFKVFRVVYNLLIGFIVAVYLLFSRKRFARQCTLVIRGFFSEKWAQTILDEVTLVDKMFGGFLDAKILDSAIIGVLCYLGCIIMGIPSALIVSVVVGITNMIPFFGPFIGAVPMTLLILIENPLMALWFVIFAIVLQQLDGNFIGPRIMGNRIGISGFWVMFAIILFGGLWGVMGMIIGVPLFAVIYDLVKKLVRMGLARKGKLEMWEQYRADFPNEDIQPVMEPVDNIAGWTREDWIRHLREDWEVIKTKWHSFFGGVIRVWNFVKKWTLVIWRFLKKYALIIGRFLKKCALAIGRFLKKCALAIGRFLKKCALAIGKFLKTCGRIIWNSLKTLFARLQKSTPSKKKS